MAEPEASPAPRRWYQFHLATLLAMSFVAGGFLWANVASYRTHAIVHPVEWLDDAVRLELDATARGWPWTYVEDFAGEPPAGRGGWYPVLLLANVAVALGSCGLTALASELYLRRTSENANETTL